MKGVEVKTCERFLTTTIGVCHYHNQNVSGFLPSVRTCFHLDFFAPNLGVCLGKFSNFKNV